MNFQLYGWDFADYTSSEALADRLNKYGFKPDHNSFPDQSRDFWFGRDDESDYRLALYNGSQWLHVYFEYDIWGSLMSDFDPTKDNPSKNYIVGDWARLGVDTDPEEDVGLEEKSSPDMAEFDSGARRSSAEGKPKFGYLLVPGMPYDRQMLARTARRMEEGAVLYGEHNYQKMNTVEELQRAKESLLRHAIQYCLGDESEDHLAGVDANTQICNSIEYNIEQRESGE